MSAFRCPSRVTRRRYEKSTLSESEMSAIAEHLRVCRHCAERPGRPVKRTVRMVGLACGAILILSGATLLLRQRVFSWNAPPIKRLAAVAPRDGRVFEGRLTGLPWARYVGPARNAAAAAPDYALEAEAARVVAEAADNPAAERFQEAAIANVLRRRAAAAFESIGHAARLSPTDPSIRSDAAAITLFIATTSERPEELPEALAHTDAALQQNDAHAEALFNRAKILEQMGLRFHALQGWRAYLAADATSQWADEARARVAALDGLPESKRFDSDRANAEAAVRRGDTAAVRAIVATQRQLSRAWSEVEGLGRWAEAAEAGDAERAAAELQFARAVGAAVRDINGDALLHDAVQAIDTTPAARETLIAAHLTYRRGRKLNKPAPAEAEPLLREAVAQFKTAGSPMRFVAEYYRAIALYDTQRLGDARNALLALVASTRGSAYRALDASVHWQLGMCHYSAGNWSAALAAYERGAATFGVLGETGNHGFMRVLLADLYDTVGDRERAWAERVEGFRALSDAAREDRLYVSLGGAARTELQAGRSAAAAALLNVASAEAQLSSAAETAALSWTTLASLRAGVGELRAADVALREARAAVSKLKDASAERVKAAMAVAEASIILAAEPARALSLLQHAQTHYTTTNRRAWLPTVHLHQGRALRQLDRDVDALQQWELGIRELEQQRATLTDAELRQGAFDTGEALFEDAIELMLRRFAAGDALRTAERFRARTLFEDVVMRGTTRPRVSLPDDGSNLPADVTLIEYAVLQDRLAIFCRRAGRMTTFVVHVKRDDLRAAVQTLSTGIRKRLPVAELQKPAATLWQWLMAPAAETMRGSATVVIVPDRFLQQVPFAMLYDRERDRYLVQDHALGTVPSARLLNALRQAPRSPAAHGAFVIGNPFTGGELEPLPASESEARAIASMYRRSLLSLRRDATRERFTREWVNAAVVHFGGHASSTVTRGAASSLALAGARGADYVAAHEIARMQSDATRLVVLAACESYGRGREHLETTPTLAHAFLAAGVPTVVGAIWPIDDSPSLVLFRQFHGHWRQGSTPAEALRDAQLSLLASGDAALRHPSSWAGVLVIGDPFNPFSRTDGVKP